MEGPEFNEFVGSIVDKKTREPVILLGKDPERETIGDLKKMAIVRR
jgi:hypothetical protein